MQIQLCYFCVLFVRMFKIPKNKQTTSRQSVDRRIGRASSTFVRLGTRFWKNPRLNIKTKVSVYKACALSIFLYRSASCTAYADQERRLNIFHMHVLRKASLDILEEKYIKDSWVLLFFTNLCFIQNCLHCYFIYLVLKSLIKYNDLVQSYLFL